MTMGKLLVVDDDENNRDMLSRRLVRRGFEVACADSGPRALEMVNGNGGTGGGFDVILLDVMMPGMSGLEVLQTLRAKYPATQLPVIMATAKGEREDIAEALSLGANDYVTKPIDFVVALARVEAQLAHKRAVDKIVALEADLTRQNAELASANAKMRRDLELAARLQQSLLPSAPPQVEGLHAAWSYVPCDELGGDIFNIFKVGPDQIGVYVLDVSGHGVPAALLSTTLSRVLQTNEGSSLVQRRGVGGGLAAREPLDVLNELNRRFPMSGESSQYFTMQYGVLDTQTFTFRYICAGHPPALVVKANGEARFQTACGFAVGWVDEPGFEEQALALEPGDRLYLYSDGIVEAMDANGFHFGSDRLAEVLAREGRAGATLEASLEALTAAVKAFQGDAGRTDDISVLAIERDGNR
jgi:sigma-B regulation protein RsbU (phosphoserine phosphatase)